MKNEKVIALFTSLIDRNANESGLLWLKEKGGLVSSEQGAEQLNITFSAIPRKLDKKIIEVKEEESRSLQEFFPGYSIKGWSLQRLCRVWLLMQVDTSNKENYLKKISTIFRTAEMNELVALYSSLPVLEFQEEWKMQCAEGVRSNIGIVLEAIMYDNPYPAEYLDEQAWNQMVLKAFFTEKNVKKIYGLEKRANKRLSETLKDYANERMAAKRSVNDQLWPLIEKFIQITHRR